MVVARAVWYWSVLIVAFVANAHGASGERPKPQSVAQARSHEPSALANQTAQAPLVALEKPTFEAYQQQARTPKNPIVRRFRDAFLRNYFSWVSGRKSKKRNKGHQVHGVSIAAVIFTGLALTMLILIITLPTANPNPLPAILFYLFGIVGMIMAIITLAKRKDKVDLILGGIAAAFLILIWAILFVALIMFIIWLDSFFS